jgi:hypothetical protein
MAAMLAAPATATPLGLGEVRGSQWAFGDQPCHVSGLRTASPISGVGCKGVRPGAVLQTDNGNCSFNFMFIGTDKKTGKRTRYMGTAGHCILLSRTTDTVRTPPSAEKIYQVGRGPVAKDAAGKRIGEFAYAVLVDSKDFALIRLDDGVEASPQMCYFGGPTGVNSDRPPETQRVRLHLYGQGLLTGSVLPARDLTAHGMPDPDYVNAIGVVTPGDSGSGVISEDGRAVGVAVTVGLNNGSLGSLHNGTVGITRFQPQLTRAEQELGQDLEIVTAPRQN